MTRFWWHIGLVGLGAGLCSALMVASLASGLPIAIFLLCLAPLPISIVSVGWSHWAGLVAVAAAAILLALADPSWLLAFPLIVGLPAWWLGYLALLARPAGREGELDWYPVGRLVLWAALLAAFVGLIAIVEIGDATAQRMLRTTIEHMLRARLNIAADAPLVVPGIDDPNSLIDLVIAGAPAAGALLCTILQLFSLWLAGRVVKISGRLRRPWPDLAAARLPPVTMLLLVLAFVGTFLPGISGMAAAPPTASLLLAYAVMGFAVMHGVTRFMHGRTVALFILYVGFLLLGWSGWPLLMMALLGMIDGAFDLRRRVAARRQPPPVPPLERN
ncbi:MAG TPA: DUF2232 domain-containing protein [Xanthobacteraceae bacterium]|nr:DUF2232 domain-containing protein [Xanthobacteraceae bacterium]